MEKPARTIVHCVPAGTKEKHYLTPLCNCQLTMEISDQALIIMHEAAPLRIDFLGALEKDDWLIITQ